MTLPVRPPIFIHHAAALEGSSAAPNSLEAIRACLIAGAAFIEIDVIALADTDYLLVHDPLLESETTGQGPVSACTAIAAKRLYFKNAPQYHVPKLSEVVELFLDYGEDSRLQIDFKQKRPFPGDEPLHRLLDIIQPLGNRVLVSSQADWHLRKLRNFAPWLDLGFDIGFYLDWRDGDPQPDVHPRKRGAYRYWDDHPLAEERLWSTADYLADRCASLIRLVPAASTFYLNHELILHSLDDGFNWAGALHREAYQLAAWTVDADKPNSGEIIKRLLEAGVDQFTTNTPVTFAELLNVGW